MTNSDSSPAPKRPAWQTSLDFDAQDAGHYLDFVNLPLMRMLDGAPGTVLDLGCAAGAFGAALKERHPAAKVIGVEAGRAAADKAATRLDRVIRARIEDVDFAAEGIGEGEIDTVIAADVLEHLVNPWGLLVRLKRHLAPRAQILASIPNVRNLWLVNRLLMQGRFEYVERGLLDVTHLRFFTWAEIRALFEETGYAIEAQEAVILPQLSQVYAAHREKGAPLIELGRLTLRDISPYELMELCAEQFLLRARPGARA